MTAANINLVDLVAERIKSTPVGELIKEEDLYDIVKTGIDRAFFSERPDPNSTSYHPRKLPPLIEETLRAALADTMKPLVEKWVLEHADLLTERMKTVIDNGIIRAAEAIVDAKVQHAMSGTMNALVNALNEERRAAGLPTLPVYIP